MTEHIHSISRVFIELLNNKQLDYKSGKGLELTFLQLRYINKHMKRCSAPPVFREMQVKSTMRFHLYLLGQYN